MKLLRSKGFVQKILIVLMAIILVNFSVPVQSQADFGGKLFQPITDLIIAVADVSVGLLNHFMVGTDDLVTSATLSYVDSPQNTQGDRIMGY